MLTSCTSLSGVIEGGIRGEPFPPQPIGTPARTTAKQYRAISQSPVARNLLCFIISLSEAPDLLRDRTGKGPFLRPDIHLYLATHTEPPAFRRRAPNAASTGVRTAIKRQTSFSVELSSLHRQGRRCRVLRCSCRADNGDGVRARRRTARLRLRGTASACRL